MTSYLYIKIKNYSKIKVINKLKHINVEIYDLYQKDDFIYIKIKYEDYEKVQKYLQTLQFTKERYTGFEYLKHTVKRFKILLFFFCVALFLLCLSSLIIVDIDVIHEDEKLVSVIYDELESHGIRKFSFRKSYQTIEKIKEEIKNKHLDIIDWLEISRVGMKYVIRVEERIIKNEPLENEYCHITASKDALVKNIKVFTGQAAIKINDYVQKDNILISGDIMLNDSVVNNVCASGSVKGEVWYTVNVKVPFKYYEEVKTGKKRKNIIVNYNGVDFQILKNRLEYFNYTTKEVFDLLGFKIFIRTDEEIKKVTKKYSEEQAINKALEEAKEKVSQTFQDGKIISEKVLQKRVNDSTIEVEVFIVAEEEIGKIQIAQKEIKNDS